MINFLSHILNKQTNDLFIIIQILHDSDRKLILRIYKVSNVSHIYFESFTGQIIYPRSIFIHLFLFYGNCVSSNYRLIIYKIVIPTCSFHFEIQTRILKYNDRPQFQIYLLTDRQFWLLSRVYKYSVMSLVEINVCQTLNNPLKHSYSVF